ncbi:hypothetical protein HCEG_02020 [Histoplasma capsulatum var. duboisii H88]|uniref:CFEM domain-containing protein n=1 Tax=Ajellomyces capsulatus (strain H88) TaxID=544711 RepID=F0UA33_AJEC8|nr:hypothetical protein HCEG_02020 [Histoplasma capsulatum var. duboisii H88]
MRLAISAAVATSFVALVAGQIADLPECARNCAFPAMPPECGVNPKCICSAKSFIDAMTCCVAKSCNPDEQQTDRYNCVRIPEGAHRLHDPVVVAQHDRSYRFPDAWCRQSGGGCSRPGGLCIW